MKKKKLTAKKINVPQKKAKNPLAQVLYVAEFAAAVSEGFLALGSAKPDEYKTLSHTHSGFPGVWNLCARAGYAAQQELNAIGDPHCEGYDYIELSGNLAAALFANPGTYWEDEAIAEKVRDLLDDALVEKAQDPDLLDTVMRELKDL